MAQPTNYKRTVSGSIGSGVKSVFGKSGRRYYILEHKVSSKYHQAGESQRIIVDEIEIGRDPRCQVRFDEDFSTVSRRHAAIIREKNNWKLIQLSQTNSTFLNGRRIESEWYLQNGDEIQLSVNGPKLGFIELTGDKGLVRNIGMTARLNLFRQQALRPYKTAIAVLACILLLGCGAGVYYLNQLYQKNKEQSALIAENEERHQRAMAVQDSLLNEANKHAEKLKGEIGNLKKQFGKVRQQQRSIAVSSGAIDNSAINACLPNVYFIYATSIDVTLPNGESGTLDCSHNDVPSWSGTGFLLDNGTFVTARHVVESWYFWMDGSGANENLAQLNCIANNGGKVVAHFVAISSSGQRLSLSSSQFNCNRSSDKVKTAEEGYKISLAADDGSDFAYAKVNKTGGLKFSASKSNNLERGTKLTVLGFPLGLGANSPTQINPIYGSGIVSVDGLQRGFILTTDTNYEQGCSGGPAFYTDENGNMIVIGIVSAIAGRNAGFIVPISAIR